MGAKCVSGYFWTAVAEGLGIQPSVVICLTRGCYVCVGESTAAM